MKTKIDTTTNFTLRPNFQTNGCCQPGSSSEGWWHGSSWLPPSHSHWSEEQGLDFSEESGCASEWFKCFITWPQVATSLLKCNIFQIWKNSFCLVRVLDSKNCKDKTNSCAGLSSPVLTLIIGAWLNVYITVLVDNVEVWGGDLGLGGLLDRGWFLARPGFDPAEDVDPNKRGQCHERDAEPGGDQEEVGGLQSISTAKQVLGNCVRLNNVFNLYVIT